jgi:hypothetical protein
MATFTKFYQLSEDLGKKIHNLSTDQLVVALTNTAPDLTDTVIGDITQISYTYCSTRDIVTTSYEQTLGVCPLILEDLVLTATGGAIGPFRYVVVYNDTATADNLIGFIDYGAEVTVTDTNTFTIDLTQAQTLFELTY